MRKCGRPNGSGADLQRENADWYSACDKYIGLQVKMSRADFLRSDLSGRFSWGTRSEEKSFGRFRTRYNSVKLQYFGVKINKEIKYESIEDKLVKYIKLRADMYKWGKCVTL